MPSKSPSLWRPTREALEQRFYPSQELVQRVPRNLTVAVDPAAALALLGHPGTERLYTVNERHLQADLLIARPDGWEATSEELTSGFEPCEPIGAWVCCLLAPPSGRGYRRSRVAEATPSRCGHRRVRAPLSRSAIVHEVAHWNRWASHVGEYMDQETKPYAELEQ